MRLLIAAAAFAGFVLALAVHAAAVAGVDVAAAFPAVWGLHAGIFVVFFPYVFASRKMLGPKPSWRTQKAALPAPAFYVDALLGAYALINFAWTMHVLGGGSPGLHDGRYVLESHGRVIQEIDAAQYAAGRAAELRLFSGHWMFFYFVPFAFFLFARPPAAGGPDASRAGGSTS